MPNRCQYTTEQLKAAITTSRSFAQVLQKLGLKPAGGNYKTLQNKIAEFGLSTAHFSGMGWNTGEHFKPVRPPQPLDAILVENSAYVSTYKLKKRLLREGLKKDVCELCELVEWCGKPISLHLDHINGNNRDNRLENLRVVCPNCHAQTPTYCRKKSAL
jgi:hypothetical protein